MDNAENKSKTIISQREAFERGYLRDEVAPLPVEVCQFCGKSLYWEGTLLCGKWIKIPRVERCPCKESVERWKVLDEIAAKQTREEELKARQRRDRERIQFLLGESGMGKRFYDRTFDSFQKDTPLKKAAWNTAMWYATHFEERLKDGKGLIFIGPYGTGKTHLAAAISLYLIRAKFCRVIFKNSYELFADVRRSYNENALLTEYDVLTAFKNCDLLVIDDLGKEKCTEWSMSVLYDIMNYRYEHMKPVMITTNYTFNGLVGALTPFDGSRDRISAIISRFEQTAFSFTMNFNDYRKTKEGT